MKVSVIIPCYNELGFANDDPHTKVISFSRNFGHQNAVSAGLHNCTGDIAVIIDVDLQDPPEVIPQMIDTYLKEGSNVVYLSLIHI